MDTKLIIFLVVCSVILIVIGAAALYILNKTKFIRKMSKASKKAQQEIAAEQALELARNERREQLSTHEASEIVNALGGKGNILESRQCAIRIRVVLGDYTKADEKSLKRAGVSGVIKTAKSWQLIVGERAEEIHKNF